MKSYKHRCIFSKIMNLALLNRGDAGAGGDFCAGAVHPGTGHG